jgi:hypothetical protein
MKTSKNCRDKENFWMTMWQRQHFINFSEKIRNLFYSFTNHDIRDISSFENFTKFMWTEVDAASLGICRMFFGK